MCIAFGRTFTHIVDAADLGYSSRMDWLSRLLLLIDRPRHADWRAVPFKPAFMRRWNGTSWETRPMTSAEEADYCSKSAW